MSRRTDPRDTYSAVKDLNGRDHCARHSPRVARRHARGQSLVIFALTITVLLAMAGLAVDVIRVYDLYARAQRAAEAGALAGVLYMPNFYNTGSTAPADGNSATCRAMLEVVKNGFGAAACSTASPVIANPCPANRATVAVAVCQVTGKITDLQVTVSQSTPLFLLSAVGLTSVTISASAQAEYLPQVQMGSRLNYFGDGEYTLQKFRAVANGQGDLAQFGDPYVDCQESPDVAPPGDSGNYTIYGMGTNKNPNTLLCDGNKSSFDEQPAGFSGPATAGSGNPGAHNYSITVGPADRGATVWIWNPNFIPDNVSNTPAGQLDHFQSGAQNQYGALTLQNGMYDDKRLYSNMTYTLYQVPYLYLRSGDIQVSSVTSPPYDMLSRDLSAHGCATDGSQAYDLSQLSSYQAGGPGRGGCVSTSGPGTPATFCLQQWCQISPAGGLSAGTLYRLAVEVSGMTNTTQGWGSHRYAVEVCSASVTPGTGGPCAAGAGTVVGAWNNMTVFYAIQSSVATFDLGCIPTEYAGRQINIGLFDPGDASGNVYMQIMPPAGSGVTVNVPPGIRAGAGAYANAILASNNGDTFYNGLWINTTIQLPATYTGTCSGASPAGWWTLQYSVTGQPNDTVSVNFSLVGSPVHLVQPG